MSAQQATGDERGSRPGDLEISRPVRSWEFLPELGMRAGLFGTENGRFEAWVYPLKILRDFQLNFKLHDRVVAAETLARTVTVRPESSTIVYASDTFQVRETLFVPVQDPGAVVVLEVETREPLEIQASFVRDFTLEWPAALGGTYSNWDPALRAFTLGEEQKKFVAVVGSPSATAIEQEYSTNYSSSSRNVFALGRIEKGRGTRIIAIAGSVRGQTAAENTYRHLINHYSDLLRESAEYYRKYLEKTVSLTLPDSQMQQAYDWARVSMLQGVVSNPYLGTGLVAGYRTSGEAQRPGFAWYFGRDTEWTSFALAAAGDFEHARQGLEFLSRYQRADGKIPHEISQTASLVNWFKSFPYPWASADATPLFIIAARDYVVRSGDVAFANGHWDNIWRAYQFLHSTWDTHGFAQNFGIGHGWVEGGPLRPPEQPTPPESTKLSAQGGAPAQRIIKTELYQTGLGIEALRALAYLARLTGRDAIRGEIERAADLQRPMMNQKFWNPDKKLYAFALDPADQRIDVATILATVPMWFGLLDSEKAEPMINLLADSDFESDWGARIISSLDPRYDPGGYHYGSVWPLFTGWAAVGEYRYHRALAAYSNLHANAQLALDGSLGHVTEVLSGDYYQPLSTSSPHQVWSSAMVVSPLLVGLMGLQNDAPEHRLVFAPHPPGDWNSFQVGNVQVGAATLDLAYSRNNDEIRLDVTRSGAAAVALQFAPAVSLHAKIVSTEVNGSPAAFHLRPNSEDQHVVLDFPLAASLNKVRIRLQGDFNVTAPAVLPLLGAASHNLNFVSESWCPDHSQLTLDVSGVSGNQYQITMSNPSLVVSVQGEWVARWQDGAKTIQLNFPAEAQPHYVRTKVVIQLAKQN